MLEETRALPFRVDGVISKLKIKIVSSGELTMRIRCRFIFAQDEWAHVETQLNEWRNGKDLTSGKEFNIEILMQTSIDSPEVRDLCKIKQKSVDETKFLIKFLSSWFRELIKQNTKPCQSSECRLSSIASLPTWWMLIKVIHRLATK